MSAKNETKETVMIKVKLFIFRASLDLVENSIVSKNFSGRYNMVTTNVSNEFIINTSRPRWAKLFLEEFLVDPFVASHLRSEVRVYRCWLSQVQLMRGESLETALY